MTRFEANAPAVYTIAKYVEIGKALGHEVAVLGERSSDKPFAPRSIDVEAFDYAVFVVYESSDLPGLPTLAHVLDRMPRERRIVIDCCGRFNDTIRVEHDFNHSEELEGHQGWEWIEGLAALSDVILQPTPRPLRPKARTFLFHGFDPAAVRGPTAPDEAALRWSANGTDRRPYGAVYVGTNWQRWTQMRRFVESVAPLRHQIGPICLAGWGWDERPEWAAALDFKGVDVNPDLLDGLDVETRWGVPFDEIADLASQARFSPVVHRPLFNLLGLVTNRTFETFTFDTIPLLLIPDDVADSVYGPDARPLVAGDDALEERIRDMLEHPEVYWQAVAKTRAHLAEHHSFARRFAELEELLSPT